MSQGELTVSRIEIKNGRIGLCFFESALYGRLPFGEKIKPMERVLVDSDQKQLIYIVESEERWLNIRFPQSVWLNLDQLFSQNGELFLVVSLTEEGGPAKSIPLKHFDRECIELIGNIRHNANYGRELPELVEASFKRIIAHMKQ
jgi:hypothetical protein